LSKIGIIIPSVRKPANLRVAHKRPSNLRLMGGHAYGHYGRRGDPGPDPGDWSELDVKDQEEALKVLASLVEEDSGDPQIRQAAIRIVDSCDARDDVCELSEIFNAVKSGSKKVSWLRDGLKYMSDPRAKDWFPSPSRLMKMCQDGACAEDCDGHAVLVAALAASLGFRVGLRAYAKPGRPKGNYEHIYAVAMLPKVDDGSKPEVFALDTSADAGVSYAGWEPPRGQVLTAWME